MRRTLMLLSLAAVFLLPTSVNEAHAQGNVEVRNFVGKVHPLRKIVRLNWWANEDSTLAGFTILHSTDGLQYASIGDIPAIMNGEDGHIYEFWHVGSVLGLNYYQLQVNFNHGGDPKIIGPIMVDVGAPPIYSYPTFPRPGGGGETPLQGDNDENWLEARISDLYGRPVAAMREGSRVDIPDLPSGMYVLSARYASGWHSTTFVVTQD